MKKIFLTLAVIAFAFAANSGCGSKDANNDGTQTDEMQTDEMQTEDTMDQPADGAGDMTEDAAN
ncbi:MAG: hypothetical protein ABIH86_02540 [Planctomycetota bacterium]